MPLNLWLKHTTWDRDRDRYREQWVSTLSYALDTLHKDRDRDPLFSIVPIPVLPKLLPKPCQNLISNPCLSSSLNPFLAQTCLNLAWTLAYTPAQTLPQNLAWTLCQASCLNIYLNRKFLDRMWLVIFHCPIPNATSPPMAVFINRSTYHKSTKVSLHPVPKSDGHPKSMNKLTVNKLAVRDRMADGTTFFSLFSCIAFASKWLRTNLIKSFKSRKVTLKNTQWLWRTWWSMLKMF